MANTSKTDALKHRDIAYYQQRQKNRVFSSLTKFFAEEAAAGRVSKKELADKTGKDPSQITRLFSGPSNLELDTISDVLLAMGAEMDHSIVRFADRARPNYQHPTISQQVHTSAAQLGMTTQSTPATPPPIRIVTKPSDVLINTRTTTSG